MKRRGYTLVEILLALALSAVLLGLLGVGLSVQLRVAGASRNALEGTRAARIALRQIATDLRNTIPLTNTPYVMGGIVGDHETIQMEISHMPLLGFKKTQPEEDRQLAAAPPGDVRTVHYRISGPDDRIDGRQRNGLLRIECERAALAWALRQGESDAWDRLAEELVPEVEKIEFAYYDGRTEYAEWDSIEQGKLPTAVRVAVAVRTSADRKADNQRNLAVYEELVSLPNLRSTLQQALAEAAGQTTTISSGSSSTTGGTAQ